jgi:uncharacterized protein with HEPN domain
MSNRDINLYFADILESIEAINDFTKGYDFASFVSDRKTYSATLREFIVIGEAIAHIPEEIRAGFPDVAWRLIKDFRNFIVHEYFGIDPEIVWDAVEKELPVLLKEVAKLQANLVGSSSSSL